MSSLTLLDSTTSLIEDLTKVKDELTGTQEKITEISQNLFIAFGNDENLSEQICKLLTSLEDAQTTLDYITIRVREHGVAEEDQVEIKVEDEVEIKIEQEEETDLLELCDPLSIEDARSLRFNEPYSTPPEACGGKAISEDPNTSRRSRRKQQLSSETPTYQKRPELALPKSTALQIESSNKSSVTSSKSQTRYSSKPSQQENLFPKVVIIRLKPALLEKLNHSPSISKVTKVPQTTIEETTVKSEVAEEVLDTATVTDNCDINQFIIKGTNTKIDQTNHNQSHRVDLTFPCKYCAHQNKTFTGKTIHESKCSRNPKHINKRIGFNPTEETAICESSSKPGISVSSNENVEEFSHCDTVEKTENTLSDGGKNRSSDEDYDPLNDEIIETEPSKRRKITKRRIQLSKTFPSTSVLKNHLNRKQSCDDQQKVPKYECPKECGRKFLMKSHANTHIKHCTGLRNPVNPEDIQGPPWGCPICHIILDSKEAVIRHSKKHVVDPSIKCAVCDKTFAVRRYLDSHMRVHSEVRKYVCDKCPSTFKYDIALVKHLKNMHSEAPYTEQCYICGRLFKHANLMKNHIRKVHQNIRPHKCNRCEKSFKEKTHLAYHLKTHDNPKSKKRGLNQDKKDPNSFTRISAGHPQFQAKDNKQSSQNIQNHPVEPSSEGLQNSEPLQTIQQTSDMNTPSSSSLYENVNTPTAWFSPIL